MVCRLRWHTVRPSWQGLLLRWMPQPGSLRLRSRSQGRSWYVPWPALSLSPAVCAHAALLAAVQEVAEQLSGVSHTILVLSGKGGVGKSTVSAQLAFTLASQGKHVRGGAHNLMHTGTSRACSQVGLLDVDICGPSIPRMLGLSGREVHQSGSGWSPVWLDDNLGVMSIGFVLPATDDAVIWRGPRKSGTCRDPCVGLAVFAWRPMAGWS